MASCLIDDIWYLITNYLNDTDLDSLSYTCKLLRCLCKYERNKRKEWHSKTTMEHMRANDIKALKYIFAFDGTRSMYFTYSMLQYRVECGLIWLNQKILIKSTKFSYLLVGALDAHSDYKVFDLLAERYNLRHDEILDEHIGHEWDCVLSMYAGFRDYDGKDHEWNKRLRYFYNVCPEYAKRTHLKTLFRIRHYECSEMNKYIFYKISGFKKNPNHYLDKF